MTTFSLNFKGSSSFDVLLVGDNKLDLISLIGQQHQLY